MKSSRQSSVSGQFGQIENWRREAILGSYHADAGRGRIDRRWPFEHFGEERVIRIYLEADVCNALLEVPLRVCCEISTTTRCEMTVSRSRPHNSTNFHITNQ